MTNLPQIPFRRARRTVLENPFFHSSSRRQIFAILTSAILTLTFLSGAAQFFRIEGPVPTTITGIQTNGQITWTNALTNATFKVRVTDALGGATVWNDYVHVPGSNGVTTHRIYDPHPPAGMTLIPGGLSVMGNTMTEGDADERPLHEHYISAFYLDICPVTKALWDEVYHWATNRPEELRYSFELGAQGKAPDHPAQNMSWFEAVKWCNARSEKEGRTPAYYTDAAQTSVYRAGETNVQNAWVNWRAGYRLPTEAEWEKAARGGIRGRRFPWADADTITHARANYLSKNVYAYDVSATRGSHPVFAAGEQPYTNPVWFFPPNGYGLHDMAGNVFAWCWDWYDSSYYYSSASATDPVGPVSASYRVYRGGDWRHEALYARVSYRNCSLPTRRFTHLGFRTALSPAK